MQEKQNNHYNRKTVIILTTVMLIVGAFFLARWMIHNLMYVSTDDAQVKGNLAGTATKVSARVLELKAEEGDKVKKGEILARLDDRELKASLREAEARAKACLIDEKTSQDDLGLRKQETGLKIGLAQDSLKSSQENLTISQQDLAMQDETAQTEVNRQQDAVEAAQDGLAQARAIMDNADLEAQRAQKLFLKGAISKQDQEKAQLHKISARKTAQASQENLEQQQKLLVIAKSRLRTIKMKQGAFQTAENNLESSARNLQLARLADTRIAVDREKIAGLKAKLEEAKAKTDYYRVLLGETVVKSPVTGQVARRNINLGEVTSPGTPLFYLLDEENIWVQAHIQENRIRQVKPGAEVKIHIDAYPGKLFRGRVQFVGAAATSEFSLFPSESSSGNFIKVTHRIPVRIEVDNSRGWLKPGMNAVVDIRCSK